MSATAQKVFGSTLFFWLALAVFCLWFVWPLRDTLRFGIDLVGGTYITLEVQAEKAIEARLVELMQKLKKQFKASSLPKPTSAEIKPVFEGDASEKPISYALLFSFETNAAAQNAATFIQEQYRTLQVSAEGADVKVRYTPVEEKQMKLDAVERNIEVIRTRIDRLGVSETPIAQQGERNIIVELPDVSDPQRAKAMIGKAAVLEFKLVEQIGRTEEDVLYEYDGELPSDFELLPGKMEQGTISEYYVVPRYTELTGKLLANAKAAIDNETRQWVVQFSWNPEGGDKFYDLTSKNNGRNVAMILDGVVITAPRISTSIRTEGHITGSFTADGAKELALLLKSGSFVAPITFEEERQVGPSLGAESIRRGLLSCMVGLGLVFIFALFYYKLSGLFAFIALLFNMLLVLFGLVRVGATLTLPGMAGMVLTIGMAIDASILIYERIKEELKKGEEVKEAVNKGFSNAQWVILDGNITTFIVGFVLYQFGTGPIQGFAVTMMLGIIATLITGLFFLRSIFTFMLNNLNVQKLSI